MLYLINYKDNTCVYDLLICKYEKKLKTEDFSTLFSQSKTLFFGILKLPSQLHECHSGPL